MASDSFDTVIVLYRKKNCPPMEMVFLPKTFSTIREANKFIRENKQLGLTDRDFQVYKGKSIKGENGKL